MQQRYKNKFLVKKEIYTFVHSIKNNFQEILFKENHTVSKRFYQVFLTSIFVLDQQLKQHQFPYFFVLFIIIKQSIMTHCLSSEDNESTRVFTGDSIEPERVGSYTLIRKIAITRPAIVCLATKNGLYYALKIYDSSPNNDRIFRNQLTTLQHIGRKGIVPIQECLEGVDYYNEQTEEHQQCNILVMPFLEKGDLFNWVQTRGKFEERMGRYFVKELTQQFLYLDHKNIFHRDIKAQNIMIGDDYKPLLIDFGLAAEKNQLVRGFAGTSRYAAPQVIKEKEYTAKSQIYSLGILLFFMMTGQYPYDKAKITESGYRLLFQKKFNRFWQIFESKTSIKLSSQFKNLFVSMVDHDPSKRPSFQQLLEFQWFQQNSATYLEFQAYMSNLEKGLKQ